VVLVLRFLSTQLNLIEFDCIARAMNYATIILLCAVALFLPLVFTVVVPRYRMERRARALLAQYPGAERTSVYLSLHSTWPAGKQREMDAKIAEMKARGLTFLRATEANPLRTIHSWGGGLTLHFIQTRDSESSHAAARPTSPL